MSPRWNAVLGPSRVIFLIRDRPSVRPTKRGREYFPSSFYSLQWRRCMRATKSFAIFPRTISRSRLPVLKSSRKYMALWGYFVLALRYAYGQPPKQARAARMCLAPLPVSATCLPHRPLFKLGIESIGKRKKRREIKRRGSGNRNLHLSRVYAPSAMGTLCKEKRGRRLTQQRLTPNATLFHMAEHVPSARGA